MYDPYTTPPPYPIATPYGHPVYPVEHGSGSQRWLPLLSLILSATALMGVLALAVLLVADSGSGASSTLTGQARTSSPRGALSGRDLGVTVRRVAESDDHDVTTMTCPDTRRVDQGAVTVCHADMDGAPWVLVVYFENDQGLFAVQLL